MNDETKRQTVASARFIREAIDSGVDYTQIVKDPRGTAAQIGSNIDGDTHARISQLNDPAYAKSAKVPSANAITFLNKVLLDGRYITNWMDDVELAANALGVAMNAELKSELSQLRIDDLLEPDNVPLDASVATTAAGVVAAVAVGAAVSTHHIARPKPVLDFSNVPKF